jgi:hypothetical protein
LIRLFTSRLSGMRYMAFDQNAFTGGSWLLTRCDIEFADHPFGQPANRHRFHFWRYLFAHFTSSKSPGIQVLSNQGCSGP